MYEVKKSGHIRDGLRIIDDDRVLEIPVDLSIDHIIRAYNIAEKNMAAAMDKMNSAGETEVGEAYEALGMAILALFRVVFGEDGTVSIVNFYGGDYTDMLTDIAPFITERIKPALSEAVKAKKDKYKAVMKR